jgi:predicted enzyme related to lactoylglutathione lyase
MNEKPKFGFIVEYVKDIEATKRFYIEEFGLEVEREHPTYVQFETFALATDEPMGGEAGLEVYWLVDDAEAAFGSLSAKAQICLPLKQVPFGKVFGVRDPDGHPRYILELSKNRPSQAVSKDK